MKDALKDTLEDIFLTALKIGVIVAAVLVYCQSAL